MVSTRSVRYKFSEGERVLCYEPDPTKAKVLYDSKVLEVIESKDKRGRRTVEYLIHFQGWNSSWDRCVGEDFVLKDTDENRQLQRDLADKSQLQLGSYLYRRERKKGSGSSSGPGPAKRSRQGFSDDGSSSSTQPDEAEGSAEGGGETGDTDSSGSGRSAATPPPQGRVHIALPPGLRDRLTFDYHVVVKRGRVCALPARVCAAAVLESWVRWWARAGVWRPQHHPPPPADPANRKEKVLPHCPDLLDVTSRLNLVREVADGLRVYFDFILPGHLLYKQELNQYHQICARYMPHEISVKRESAPSECAEDCECARTPEYDHLPPDPQGDDQDMKIPQIFTGIIIKTEIKEEPIDEDDLDIHLEDVKQEIDDYYENDENIDYGHRLEYEAGDNYEYNNEGDMEYDENDEYDENEQNIQFDNQQHLHYYQNVDQMEYDHECDDQDDLDDDSQEAPDINITIAEEERIDVNTDIEMNRDVMENYTDVIENDADGIENYGDGVENDTEAIEHDTEAIENDTGVIDNDAEGIENDTGVIENDTDMMEKDTDEIENDTDEIENDTDAIEENRDVIEMNTDVIQNNTDGIEENRGVVEMNSDVTEIEETQATKEDYENKTTEDTENRTKEKHDKMILRNAKNIENSPQPTEDVVSKSKEESELVNVTKEDTLVEVEKVKESEGMHLRSKEEGKLRKAKEQEIKSQKAKEQEAKQKAKEDESKLRRRTKNEEMPRKEGEMKLRRHRDKDIAKKEESIKKSSDETKTRRGKEVEKQRSEKETKSRRCKEDDSRKDKDQKPKEEKKIKKEPKTRKEMEEGIQTDKETQHNEEIKETETKKSDKPKKSKEDKHRSRREKKRSVDVREEKIVVKKEVDDDEKPLLVTTDIKQENSPDRESEESEFLSEVRRRNMPRAKRATARRLRSHKSAVSQCDNEEPVPSTSSEHNPLEAVASSVCSSGSSVGEPVPHQRTPLSLLLDKVSKWQIIPREGTDHLPSRVYGAIHLARLFVRLPEFLNASSMPDFKLKLIVKHIHMFIQYLEEHSEWFGESYYTPES